MINDKILDKITDVLYELLVLDNLERSNFSKTDLVNLALKELNLINEEEYFNFYKKHFGESNEITQWLLENEEENLSDSEKTFIKWIKVIITKLNEETTLSNDFAEFNNLIYATKDSINEYLFNDENSYKKEVIKAVKKLIDKHFGAIKNTNNCKSKKIK